LYHQSARKQKIHKNNNLLTLTVMKAIIFSAALCLVSSAAFSIGRPHNVFATHRAIVERAEAKQPKKVNIPNPSDLSQKTQNGLENARRTAVSMVGGLVRVFTKFIN
jgi:hypothetical protein